MQIEIKLAPAEPVPIRFDYLYPMYSALMRNLTSHHPELAHELHDGAHENRLKMFVFSPLSSSPSPRLVQLEHESRKRVLFGGRVWFRIASPWPEFLNALAESLLPAGQLDIAGQKFKLTAVNMIAPPEFKEQMVWRPFGQSTSISASWSPPGTGKKYFIYPDRAQEDAPTDAPDCARLLADNLAHKFKRLREIRPDIADAWLKNTGMDSLPEKNPIAIEFLPHSPKQPYKTVMHRIKNSVVKSWRCPMRITAPPPIQRLIWAAGLGNLNSQGYGLMQEGKEC